MNQKIGSGTFLAWLVAIVAIAAVATSIWIHPPSEARARRFDQVRMQNLNQTETAIHLYYLVHQALPVELKALDSEENHHQDVKWHDPETRQPFEYALTGDATYRLCAIFARTSDQNDQFIGINGAHGAGRDCFQMKVTPQGTKPSP
jgi:type II secretory pathway pseudopilin PulG